ncbi:unnamed protein product [Blepharisma stoltei]|uniref:Uncharacterized protein n=1 Tax=Blepharisma stoltei TaxID=1481888 RepID=A0AAU9JMK0_9CILI|nr:unnamed protein product [Blepharisma stoltei]
MIRRSDITIPIVSDNYTSPVLTILLHFLNFQEFLNALRWNKQLLFMEILQWIEMHYWFKIASNGHRITIVNDENKRMVKSQYQKDDFEEYKTFL